VTLRGVAIVTSEATLLPWSPPRERRPAGAPGLLYG